MCVCQILDLLIEVFNKGGDAKLDVAINCNHVPELTRLSPYVAICFTVMIVVNAGLLKKNFSLAALLRLFAFSALTLFVGHQDEHPACQN